MAVKDQNAVEMIDGEFVDKTAVVPARVNEIAVEINVIKRETAETLARGSIKIGQLLQEVKESLPYGSWEDWLRDNVDYSVTTAQRFMKLADAYAGQLASGDEDVAELLACMLPSKAYVLAQLAPAQRKAFVQENDTEHMSVREMQAAIKAKDEAERRADEARQAAEAEQQRADAAEEARADLAAQLAELQSTLKAVQSGGQISAEDRAAIEAEARKAAEEAAKAKIEAAKKKAEKELEKARAEGAEALKKVTQEQERAVKAAVDQAREEAAQQAAQESAARIAELEAQVKASAAIASPYRIKFGACFEALQADYGRMVAIVKDAETNDPDEGALLRPMLDQVVNMLRG